MLSRLNAYRIMWVFVTFDLPTNTKEQRKAYREFREFLLESGFIMIQFSVYARPCASREMSAAFKKRVKSKVPDEGAVLLHEVTDKQFGMMEFYVSPGWRVKPEKPKQLKLF